MSNTRTLVLLEAPIRKTITTLAHKEGISISSKCRDLIKHALELEEDLYWNQTASSREKNTKGKWVNHKDAWK